MITVFNGIKAMLQTNLYKLHQELKQHRSLKQDLLQVKHTVFRFSQEMQLVMDPTRKLLKLSLRQCPKSRSV